VTDEPLIPDRIPAELAAAVRQIPQFMRYLEQARAAGQNPLFYFDKKLRAWRVYTKKCIACGSKKISELAHSGRKGTLEIGFQVHCKKCQRLLVGPPPADA
jgi:hypothetical protein